MLGEEHVTNPLQVLRSHGFVVGYADGKVTLEPPGYVTIGVRYSVLRFAHRHHTQLLCDLAEEEAYDTKRARGQP